MKKLLIKSILLSLFALLFISCSSDSDELPWVEPQVSTKGVYILNTGAWLQSGSILSSLSYYDIDSKKLTSYMFKGQNNIELGDTGQDMLIYGSKMYISVTVSNRIYVTDHKAKLLKDNNGADAIIEPKNGNEPQEPRYLVAHKGYVYATLQAGYVARIDTVTMSIKDKIKVETYPEQMAVAGDKLYVTNSRGTSNTVSVINLNNFTKEKNDIIVAINPSKITKDKYGNIYVISMGDYKDGGVKPTLQKIDVKTNTVSIIGTEIASGMAINKSGDKLYLMYEEYDPQTYASHTKLSYYDINTNTYSKQSFIKSDVDVSKTSNISVDPVTGNIYLAIVKDYTENAKMYVFNADGQLTNTIDNTHGLNPAGAYFLTQVSK